MSQSLFARIDGQDFEIDSFDIDWAIDQANEFELKVLAKEFNWRDARFSSVEVYDAGSLVISGFVDKSPKLVLKDDDVLLVSLKCLDEIGRLTCDRAKYDAHYQDQQVLGIITDLLSVASDAWVTQLNNMVDPLAETTLDLRSKEVLFAQLIEAVKATPQVHIRYGGQQPTGEYILEIGNFGDVNSEGIQGHNLVDIELEYNTQKNYNIVEAYGDLTTTQRITLSDALADARTAIHPDYAQFPISLDAATGSYICTNTALAVGCAVRKSFNIIKTKNNAVPTAAEIAEAGYALWRKTVRFMQQSVDYETYSAEVVAGEAPVVGDNMYIQSSVLEPVFDAVSGKIINRHETFSVADDYRITKVSFNSERATLFEQQAGNILPEERVYKVELTSNEEAEEIDADVELFNRLEDHSQFDEVAYSLEIAPIQRTTLTYNNLNPADCNGSGVLTGKQFLHIAPPPPGWATQVVTWFVTNPTNMDLYNLTEPLVPGQNWSVCAQPNGGVWPPPPGVNYTIDVYWLYLP